MVSLTGPSFLWVPFLNSETPHKVHYPLFAGCVDILFEVFHNGRRTDKTLDYHFKKQKQWGARDRKWVAEQVYTCVRGWRQGLACLGVPWQDSSLPGFSSDGPRPDQKTVSNVLKVCLLQKGLDISGFREPGPNWNNVPLQPKNLASDWFYELGQSQLEDWDDILSSQNSQAPAFLRVNLLKAPDVLTCISRLEKEGVSVQAVEECDTALRLLERKNVFQTSVFKEGWVEMQDVASQMVAPFLIPMPGERVIDACAGAGGKTLHLAERMQNKGQLIALDIHEWKLKELKVRSRRAGVSNLETRVISSSKVVKRLKGSADALLLDVPCTGSGVLRRNPDPKWRLNNQEYQSTLQLQQQLLQNYSGVLKDGGRMVYSTCSVLPDENSRQVKAFLESPAGQGFQLQSEFFNWPHTCVGDGFYAALLVFDHSSAEDHPKV